MHGCLQRIACILLISSAGLQAQTRQCIFAREKVAGEIVLTAQGGDPMLSIVEQVRGEYGWLISYEQPIFNPANMIDVAIPEWRRKHPGEVGVLVPRVQTLSVRFPPPALGTRDEEKTLELLVEQANAAHTFVHYGLVHGVDNRYSIYGEDAYRGTNGVAGVAIKIRDTPTTGQDYELTRVLEACSAQSPIPFVWATVEQNSMKSLSKHVPETCRNGLQRLVQAKSSTAIYQIMEDTLNKVMVVNVLPFTYRDSSGDCPSGSKPGAVLR